MFWKQIFSNEVLIASLVAWGLAQGLKVPIEYLRTRKFNWALLLRAGGMPSSHSSIVSAVSISTGLNYGFDSPMFALAFVIAMIVSYDASGVRRQAGLHAEKINYMINELLKGHAVSDDKLKEVLGHTQAQVIAGAILGIVIALLFWVL